MSFLRPRSFRSSGDLILVWHGGDIPSQYTPSTHLLNTPHHNTASQHIFSTLFLNTPSQPTPSIHPLNTPYQQPNLSTHPIPLSTHPPPTLLTHPQPTLFTHPLNPPSTHPIYPRRAVRNFAVLTMEDESLVAAMTEFNAANGAAVGTKYTPRAISFPEAYRTINYSMLP